jgi:hypothetical protein
MVEMTMAVSSSLILLASIIVAGVALQRSFAAVEGYSVAEGDQLRVSDYIAMDVRRATDASVDPNTNDLTLTIPNYYTANNDHPTWTNARPTGLISNGNGGFSYGTGTTEAGTTAIKYTKVGSTFVREIDGVQRPIATNVSSFTVTPNHSTSSVSYSITFAPKFTRWQNPDAVTGTTVYSNTFLRNAVARQ